MSPRSATLAGSDAARRHPSDTARLATTPTGQTGRVVPVTLTVVTEDDHRQRVVYELGRNATIVAVVLIIAALVYYLAT